jgi:outer membrane protein assembly factor BamB
MLALGLAGIAIAVLASLSSNPKDGTREAAPPPPTPQQRAHEGSWVRPDRSELVRLFGVRWTARISDPPLLQLHPEEWTSPYISGDHARVYYGTTSGLLEARSVASGAVLWSKKSMGTIGASMTEYHGKLIVGAGSNLLGLDAENGQEKWRIDLAGGVGGRIVLTSSMAVIPVRPNSVVAVDAEKGAILWRQKRPTPEGITLRGEGTPTIDVARGRVYDGFSDGTVVASSLAKGDTIWATVLVKGPTAFADIDAQPILIDGGKALIVASYAGGLAKLDTENGRILWRREVDRITAMTRAGPNGLLIASHGDAQVLGLSPESGKIRWRFRFRKGSPTAPIYVGRDMVLVGNIREAHAVLDVATGRPIQLLAFGTGSTNEPAWRDPDLAFLTNRGDIFMLRYGGGSSITEGGAFLHSH